MCRAVNSSKMSCIEHVSTKIRKSSQTGVQDYRMLPGERKRDRQCVLGVMGMPRTITAVSKVNRRPKWMRKHRNTYLAAAHKFGARRRSYVSILQRGVMIISIKTRRAEIKNDTPEYIYI